MWNTCFVADTRWAQNYPKTVVSHSLSHFQNTSVLTRNYLCRVHMSLNQGTWLGPEWAEVILPSFSLLSALPPLSLPLSRKASSAGKMTNQLVILLYLLRDNCTWARTSKKSNVYPKKIIPSGLEFQTRFN